MGGWEKKTIRGGEEEGLEVGRRKDSRLGGGHHNMRWGGKMGVGKRNKMWLRGGTNIIYKSKY